MESLIHWKNIHHHEMFECPYWSIFCSSQVCQFSNNVETVIIHSTNCFFHLLYCAICKSFNNVSVLTLDWNVIKFQRLIPSVFKYYHNISTTNHSHTNVIIRTNWYIETFEIRAKINYDMFRSVELTQPPPASFVHSINSSTPKYSWRLVITY